MNHRAAIVLLVVLPAAAFALAAGAETSYPQQPERPAPRGKHWTDRSIDLPALVKGSPERVFELWTTVEGVNQFFGTDAVIDLEAGVYEIYFLPRDHPESVPNSSKGARLLELEKPHRLSFEWTAPPFAAELNVDPLPMWVEVSIEPEESAPGYSRVRVQHHGFGRSPQWDRTFEFFCRGWSQILYRLDRRLARPSGKELQTSN